MELNFGIMALAALLPLVLGFVWYNPKVFGNAWMTAAGITEDKMNGSNMGLIFGLTYVFSFLIAFEMNFIVVHQWSIYSILADEPGMKDKSSEISIYISNFMANYGNHFRTFKHGALHGTIAGIFLIIPVVGVNALFERRGFKYIMINAGFWIVNFALMGGVICQWG